MQTSTTAIPAAATPTPTRTWPRWAPLFAVLVWTGNTLVTRRAAGVIDPASIAFWRWAIAFAVLTPFLARPAWHARRAVVAHAGKLALLGVLGMATYQGLAYQAARTATAVEMGVMVALMPLASALLASAVAREAVAWRQVGGTLVSLAGLVVLATRGHPAGLACAGANVGEGLMLVAVASNALYGVLLRRWALPLTPWVQLYVQVGCGVLALLGPWLAGPMTPISAANAGLVAYAALPASIAAPYFWMAAVRHHGAPRASLWMNLLPPLVAVGAWALLGEALRPYHAVGGLLALAGVAWGAGAMRVTRPRSDARAG